MQVLLAVAKPRDPTGSQRKHMVYSTPKFRDIAVNAVTTLSISYCGLPAKDPQPFTYVSGTLLERRGSDETSQNLEPAGDNFDSADEAEKPSSDEEEEQEENEEEEEKIVSQVLDEIGISFGEEIPDAPMLGTPTANTVSTGPQKVPEAAGGTQDSALSDLEARLNNLKR